MKNRVLLQEINQILERIDKKISESKDEQFRKTPEKKCQDLNYSNSSIRSINDMLNRRSKSQTKLNILKKKTDKKPNPENHSFSPLICKNSLRILSRCQSNKNTLGGTSNNLSGIDKANFPYTFKPETNQHSTKILKKAKKTRKVPWEELYKLSYTQKPKKNIEIEEIPTIKELSEKEFTFKPTNPDHPNIFERHSSWLQDKSEKIMALAELERYKEYKECTFNPKIKIKPKELSEDCLETINGVRLYLQRQKAVKKNTELKQSKSPQTTYKDLSLQQYNNAVSDLKNYLHSFNMNY